VIAFVIRRVTELAIALATKLSPDLPAAGDALAAKVIAESPDRARVLLPQRGAHAIEATPCPCTPP
jgi:hypothetical protein